MANILAHRRCEACGEQEAAFSISVHHGKQLVGCTRVCRDCFTKQQARTACPALEAGEKCDYQAALADLQAIIGVHEGSGQFGPEYRQWRETWAHCDSTGRKP